VPDSVSAVALGGRFQILALDGGGAKALFSVHVLARLEADLGVRIAAAFDLITGTSAGGIIALALGAGLRPAEIVAQYERLIATVFPRDRRRWWRLPGRLTHPSYDASVLRSALEGVLGTRLLGDSSKRLVVPSWDVHKGGVHIFKTPHHERLRRDWKIPMVDVAMATSAAPSYFDAAHVDGHRLVDGGVWANNPSVVGITEAVSMLGVPLPEIGVLNIGTTDQVSHHPKKLDTGGLATWARHAVPLVLAAGSRGAQGIAEHLVGKNNYSRFDAVVPGGLYALDNADPDDLAGYAASASRELSPVFTARFAAHRATAYQPPPWVHAAARSEPAAQRPDQRPNQETTDDATR
jgi:patatin-like phospholipase/acyl hydrolase